MNKLNINCLLSLVDQLTLEDTIKFKELIQETIWVVAGDCDKTIKIIKCKNLDELIDKLVRKDFPDHTCLECYNSQNRIQLLHHHKYEVCLLCETSECEHIEKRMCCTNKSDLTNEDLKTIIHNMFDYGIYHYDKLILDDNGFYEFLR